jgi:GNAT superfamily N-acetyltransferase
MYRRIRRRRFEGPMVEIALLGDRVDSIPALAGWFRKQWPDHYAHRAPTVIEQDFVRELNRTSLPVRLVAFDGGALAGTIVLRERALDVHPQYAPGLGGLFVAEPCRRRGVGTQLVLAATALARDLNHDTLYTATATAGGLVERLGWQRIETVLHLGDRLAIYRLQR